MGATYGDGELLAQSWRHEAERDAPDGHAEPEAGGAHSGCEGRPLADLDHERHDPAAQRDFDADVGEKEQGTDPRHAIRERFSRAAPFRVRRLGVRCSELGAGLGPEGCCRSSHLDGCSCDHDIVESIPTEVTLGDHGGRNERTQHRPQSIEAVQEAENLVCRPHVADPRVPGRILQSVAKPRENEHQHQHRIRRMDRDNNVCNEMRPGTEERNATLAQRHVDLVVQQGRGSVAHQGREEDQGYHRIIETVIVLKL